MEDLDIPGVANFEICYHFFSLLKYQYSFDRLIDIVSIYVLTSKEGLSKQVKEKLKSAASL